MVCIRTELKNQIFKLWRKYETVKLGRELFFFYFTFLELLSIVVAIPTIFITFTSFFNNPVQSFPTEIIAIFYDYAKFIYGQNL